MTHTHHFPCFLSFSFSLSIFLPPSPFLPFTSISISLPLPFTSHSFHLSFRLHVRAFNIWGAISPQRCQIDTWSLWITHRKSTPGSRMVKDRWRHVTPKDQGRDPIISEAPYLRNCARWTHGHNRPPIGSRPRRVKWSRVWWRHVTPKGQGRDPIICETSYLDLSLIHIWRCRRIERCRSRWSPYH